MTRTALLLAGALAALLVAPLAAGAEPVRLVQRTSAPQTFAGDPSSNLGTTSGPRFARGACGARHVPIAVGWSARGVVPTAIRWLGRTTAAGYEARVARPIARASIRMITLCASGPVRATRASAKQGQRASCGAKTALGFLALESAKQGESISSGPSGRTGWVQTASPDPAARSGAVCVDAAAFTKVSSHTVTDAFELGERTAIVRASCPRTKRAIGWGFFAPVMSGNSHPAGAGPDSLRSTFVESAVPSSSSWLVTFATPDLRGATNAAPVTATVVCGVPRTT